MVELAYLDYDLSIEAVEGKYQARVLNSPAGQASVDFKQPFSDLELENFLLRIGRPRRGVRRLDSPEMAAAKKFGKKLFETIFTDEIYACLLASLSEAQNQEKGLRLRLRVGARDLTDLPWEYLYNPRLNQFLALSVETPIVRYLDLPRPPRPLTVAPPLKVFVIISSPSDYVKLDVKGEWEKLRGSMSGLEHRGLVKLEYQEKATLAALRRRLRQGVYHIFHFIGHGSFDEVAQEGLLLFEDEAGRGRKLSGQYLGTVLNNHHPLRLVILNACEGARTSRIDPFAGVAQTLVQQGIPAVVAMQFEITDQAAITFSQEFYAALADGYPVDSALTEARTAIFAQHNDIEWGTPVYFTRSPDGQIFDISAHLDKGEGQLDEEELERTPPSREPETDRLHKIPQWAWIIGSIIILTALGIIAINQADLFGLSLASPTSTPSQTQTLTFTSALSLTPTFTLSPTRTTTITPTPPEIYTSTPPSFYVIDEFGVPMVKIPGGPFKMGSISQPDELPVHTAILDSFYIDQLEVTNKQYLDCVNAEACEARNLPTLLESDFADHPVVNVNWYDAMDYCNWRNTRLPTEAEWEKAARGGLQEMLYPWGNEPPPVCQADVFNGARFDDGTECDDIGTALVGTYGKNTFGIYDMMGNAWEWVADWYSKDYYSSLPDPVENPRGPELGSTKVVRGGSWQSVVDSLRVSNRQFDDPLLIDINNGFRCASSIFKEPESTSTETPNVISNITPRPLLSQIAVDFGVPMIPVSGGSFEMGS